MHYIPNTDDDRRQMLKKIGVDSFEQLIDAIPDSLRLKEPLKIPRLSEPELMAELTELSNRNSQGMVCFAGGGVYDHYVPAAELTLVFRPEFMTAYTPYQAEVAQGTLQVIYEFQTHICRLTGMDVANASMYDGATSAAEAMLICSNITKRNKVVISETVNPLWRETIRTYLSARDVDIVTVPRDGLLTDLNRLEDAIDENTACVLVSQPNFFGLLEDVDPVAEMVHKVGGKLVMGIDPIAQAIIKTPGEYDADIVVGESQPLGVPMSFGGPLLGLFAAKKELVRNMPGRIAGRTKDVDGRDGFVLTLQTREQHIRREKATSNICTNEALCATMATIYCSLMGKTGIKQVALLSAERAQNAAAQIADLENFELYSGAPFVREFAVKTPVPAREIVTTMADKGMLPGIDAGQWYPGLEDCLIIALTEKRTGAEIDRLVTGLKELTTSGVLSHLS